MTGATSSGSGSGSALAFARADLLFIASFDCFGSDNLACDMGDALPWGCGDCAIEDGSFIWFFDSKPLRDWYDVVIAVVADEPLAVGVRYSVWVRGRIRPGCEGDCALPLPCSWALACASFASFDS